MERKRYAREYNLEAVRLVKARGVFVAQASRDLGVHANVLREWVRAFAADPEQGFIQLYRWFPSVLKTITIVRPETVVRWHRAGFRRYWR